MDADAFDAENAPTEPELQVPGTVAPTDAALNAMKPEFSHSTFAAPVHRNPTREITVKCDDSTLWEARAAPSSATN